MNRTLALSLLLLLSACDPKPVPVTNTPLSQAEARIAARDFPGAIDILEASRDASGQDPALVKRLVDLYRAQGEPARAIQRARAGLDAHPDAKELMLPLSALYLEANLFDEAKAMLERARTAGVAESEVALALGACLGKSGDSAGARAEFLRARAAGADEKIVLMNLGLVEVQENNVDAALKLFEELRAKHPEMASPKREIARLWLQQATVAARDTNKIDTALVNRAMDMLWNIKDELKSDWRVQEAMGDGWLLLGDFEASIAAYTEALRLGQNPKSVEDRYRVAKQQMIDAKRAEEAAAEQAGQK